MPLFVGDIVQALVIGRCYNQRILLSQTFRVTQAGPPEQTAALQLQQLNSALAAPGDDNFRARYLDCLSTDYTMLAIRSQTIHPVRVAYVQTAAVHLGAGGVGTVANDSAALTLRTATAGRDQVATKHIGPIPDDASVSGVLTVSMQERLNLLGSVMTVPIQIAPAGLTFTPVIFHKATGTHNTITTHIVGEQSRVQRRRTVGLGI